MIRILACLGFGACSRRRLKSESLIYRDFGGNSSALFGGVRRLVILLVMVRL